MRRREHLEAVFRDHDGDRWNEVGDLGDRAWLRFDDPLEPRGGNEITRRLEMERHRRWSGRGWWSLRPAPDDRYENETGSEPSSHEETVTYAKRRFFDPTRSRYFLPRSS